MCNGVGWELGSGVAVVKKNPRIVQAIAFNENVWNFYSSNRIITYTIGTFDVKNSQLSDMVC